MTQICVILTQIQNCVLYFFTPELAIYTYEEVHNEPLYRESEILSCRAAT